MDLPKLTPDAAARVETCRACPSYMKSRALNLELEKCRECGCFIHLKAMQGPKACPLGKW